MRTLFIALVLLVACKGQERTVATPTNAAEAALPPVWVSARPLAPGYYVGIGMAMKARGNHLESAKKNALNDLASEISVKVEGNSLLHTLDQRERFNESFTSTIRTSSDERIEGFELVDSWESPTEYWTYYRLSKAEHERIKAEKKASAIALALDHRSRSKEAIGSGDLRSAFDQDLRALLAMRDHWGENDLVELNGGQVPLVNELYTDLQRLTSGVRISILPERCELDYPGRYKRELLVSAHYNGEDGRRDLVQMPLFITYPGTGGKVTELKNTDAEGRARVTVQRVDARARPREVLVKLHLDELIGREMDRALVNALVGTLTVPEQRAVIDMRMPRVLMRSTESNLGVPVNEAGVAVAIREELTSEGFRFVDREGEADMILTLQAGTRRGGESNGFHTAFLDVTYSFRDRRSNEVLFDGGKQGVKGVQLDYEKAGLESFKRAVPEVRKEIVAGIMNAFD